MSSSFSQKGKSRKLSEESSFHFWTWISDLGPQNPSPGMQFQVESDFQDKIIKIRRLEAKKSEK